MSEWLLPLQMLVNDALQYDLAAQQKIKQLAGKTLVLQVSQPNVALSLIIEPNGFVLVQSGAAEPSDARVSGKASDLFAVLRAEDRTAAMMQHQINIQGDTRTFFAIQEVLSHLDIDWEMALADRVGDLAAHVLADGLRFFGSMARNQLRSLDRTGRNFLREESQWLVPTSLWQSHREKIQAVRHDADRLAARLARFEAQLQAKRAERNG